jgi:hypothetical protein
VNIFRLSRAELGTLIAERLAEHDHLISGQGASRYFWMPGQDPFEFTTPTAALSALYWRSTPPQRLKLSRALRDLAGRRAELMPLRCLEELLLTIGSIADADALMPFIRVLGARGDLGAQAAVVYGAAIRVAAGFGPCEQAWDAARELAGIAALPKKLVFDLFDLGLADTREDWQAWFLRLEPDMLRMTSYTRALAVARRLKTTAGLMTSQLSVWRIEEGLRALLGNDAFDLPSEAWGSPEEPRSMLAAAIFAWRTAPLAIKRIGTVRHLVQRDAAPTIAPVSPPGAVRPFARGHSKPVALVNLEPDPEPEPLLA